MFVSKYTRIYTGAVYIHISHINHKHISSNLWKSEKIISLDGPGLCPVWKPIPRDFHLHVTSNSHWGHLWGNACSVLMPKC